MTVADAPLAGRRVVFTGKLAAMRREEARRWVEAAGGRVLSAVSSRTDLLVVGLEGWPVLADGRISRKLAAAEGLRRHGRGPEIVSERDFLQRLGLRPAGPVAPGRYSLDQAARILGVPPRRLARWQHFGLVRADEAGRLPFQDLVGLKQIAALLAGGRLTVSRLARSLEELRSLLQVERPLSQLRVLEQAGDLVAELEGLRFDPSGQLRLFGDEPGLADAEAARQADIEAWFDYGLDCEDAGRWLDAEAAYRRVLQQDPEFAEAHFNLGNVYQARGQLPAAVAAYRRAAEARHWELAARACYNLGYALDELGRLEEAAAALRRCLVLDPGYLDAYFNLALVQERQQDYAAAAASWREYLLRDRDSDWSRLARRHLHLVERALHRRQ